MGSSIGLSEPCPDRFKGSVRVGGWGYLEHGVCPPNTSISGLVDVLILTKLTTALGLGVQVSRVALFKIPQ